jgi:predicted transcriptional regulator
VSASQHSTLSTPKGPISLCLILPVSFWAYLRRTRHEIQAGILKSCILSSLTISQLMGLQNLSYKELKPALEHLASSQLIEYEIDHRRKMVRTTDQGVLALRTFQMALAMLEGRDGSRYLNKVVGSSTERMAVSRKFVIEH